MKMTVIGLDGLSWAALREYEIYQPAPFLDEIRLKKKGWFSQVLFCDTIPHSGPSWSSIWTGVAPEIHGIFDFQRITEFGEKEEYHKYSDVKVPYVWERLYDAGIDARAFSIYNTVPPGAFRTEFEQDVRFELTLTRDEMRECLRAQAQKLFELQKDGADFIAMTVISLDKAHHMSHMATQSNMAGALDVYTMVDEWLRFVIPRLLGQVVLVSDHGLPGRGYRHPNGAKTPGHNRDGIFATNIISEPSKEWYPAVGTEFAGWVCRQFRVHPNKQIDLEEMRKGEEHELTEEELGLIEDRLRQLGYIE